MPDIRQQVLEHVQVTHAALDKAKVELEKTAAEKKAAAELIPGVVDELIKHAKIDPSDRDRATALLGNHEECLKILLKVANPAITVKPAPLGKAAGDDSKPNGYYLGQKVPGEKDSDRVFRERMGF